MLKQAKISVFKDQKLQEYPTILNFYKTPPMDEITLYEFESFSLDRLRVLKAVEAAKIRCKTDDEIEEYIKPILQEYLDLKRNTRLAAVGSEVLYKERRKDHISHFILRLAFCKTDDLKNWFIRQETALFKLRLGLEELADKERFLNTVCLHAEGVSTFDMAKIFKGIEINKFIKAMYPQYQNWDETSVLQFYKTNFIQVPDLVAKRQVLMRDGFAFVAESERNVLAINAFKQHLETELDLAAKFLPRLDEEDRLIPLLNSLSKQHVSREFVCSTSNGEKINHEKVLELVPHFPPCMQNLYGTLKKDAHLKHMGRIEFGLFLKGIGLDLDEAMIFWRKAFNRVSDDEYKKKGYAYGVRYNYGMEGKRTNYTPYSCLKVISTMPGPGESHGCPFRHFSKEHLTNMLYGLKVKDSDVTDIVQKAKDHHYQIACSKLFEVTRGQVHLEANERAASSIMIEHPNQWFEQSYYGSSSRKADSMED